MSEDHGFEIEFRLSVARTRADVFALLIDTARFRDVDAALVDVGPPGALALGRSGWMRHRRGGMTARTTWTVAAFEPPGRLVVRIDGMGYAMTEEVILEASGTGTTARFLERVWPTSLPGRILVALSGGVMRRDLRARAGRLRQLLDA